jgi:hypothetical protein
MRNFYSWTISTTRGLATSNVQAGRLQGLAAVTIADLGNPGDTRSAPGPFELLGPGDVERLAAGAVVRRYPSPGIHDAELDKKPLVELVAVDLPWRYTPELDRDFTIPGTLAPGHGIRPWLALVAGPPGPAGIVVSAGGDVTLSPAVQADHDLSMSWRWAHVHEISPDESRARILCPATLVAETDYIACLVPTFLVGRDGNVTDAWPLPGGGSVSLPCYDSWSFHTGPEGDFPELASLLKPAAYSDLGDDFGRASIHYARRGPAATGQPASADLPSDGALGQVATAASASPAPLDSWIAGEVMALIDDVATPDGRPVLTAPRYDKPFVATGSEPTSGWSGELATDPRRRGAAGIGAWASIAWQDQISAAAATKAGDLAIARDRIGHLALGLEASRSLWRRHVPPDSDPVARLAVLGPVLARLPTLASGTVLEDITGRTPLLASALWSSAARRALRQGPARTAGAAPGAADPVAVLRAAATCPPNVDDPAAIPEGPIDPDQQAQAVHDLLLRAASGDRALEQLLDGWLVAGASPSIGRLAAVLAAIDPGGGRRPTADEVNLAMQLDEPAIDPGELAQIRAKLTGLLRDEACREPDLDALARIVAAAVDPTVGRPLIVDRILANLSGVATIGPPAISPELDLPLWKFVADNSPDWLLPGVGNLHENDVVALATNPGFVEAVLTGANYQALSELRWRNIPLASLWSPMRKFWHRASGGMDIVQISMWPATSDFADPLLQPPGVGIEAVVAFKTQLFRRYPATVVYLYPNDGTWNAPAPDSALGEDLKVPPSFSGRIGDDVVFFGFPLAPSELATHWVVLEEPPAGFRFYRTDPIDKPDHDPSLAAADDFPKAATSPSAAAYAYDTFALPVRVMLGALLDIAQ